ncbi:hypothetical protein ACWD7C_38695 [Streptomyces sp. NPDC005134]|uniref:hypothetical protein n=2 Tax=unclassified Streptomyces TaxID=2593676 RepID=UPI0033A49833
MSDLTAREDFAMHSDMHLPLHHLRSAELQQRASEFRLSRRTRQSPRQSLRKRLGWALVELGLHVLPNRHGLPAPSTPRTA